VGGYVTELAKASAVIFVLRVIRLSSPLFTMILIDDVLPNMRRNVLFVVVLAMVGLYVVEAILSVFVDWMLFSTTTRMSSHISCDLFSSVFKLPRGFFYTNRTGDTVSKLGVTSTLQRILSEEPMHLVMDTFFGIVFMFFLLHLSPVLTLFSVLMVPVELFTSHLWTKIRMTKADKSVNLDNMHSGTLVESISGAETIYQTESSSFFYQIWLREIVEIIKNSVSLKKIDTIFSIIFGFISQFSSIFMWI
jgi:ABC-type bacteriocin/lantibiotic exporter with double-glycine peptidase domain